MSADNGVYVGQFPTENGFEFRVIEVQNIENTEDTDNLPKEITDAYIVYFYGESQVFSTIEDATIKANLLYEELIICEYGICCIDYPRPFPKMTLEEAKAILDGYWEGRKQAKNEATYPKIEWQKDVYDGRTILGYKQWVKCKVNGLDW